MTQDPADAILADMALLTREEWFEIAHRAGQGGPGFGPMRQLQLRIRDNPLTFGVGKLMAMFVDPAGNLLVRMIPWPRPPWKIARRWVPTGYWREKGFDMEPHRKIDPILAEWDRREAEYGPDHPLVARIVKELIRLCCYEINTRT